MERGNGQGSSGAEIMGVCIADEELEDADLCDDEDYDDIEVDSETGGGSDVHTLDAALHQHTKNGGNPSSRCSVFRVGPVIASLPFL